MDPHRVAIVCGAVVVGVALVGGLAAALVAWRRRRARRATTPMTVEQAIQLGATVLKTGDPVAMSIPVEGGGTVDLRPFTTVAGGPYRYPWTDEQLGVGNWPSEHRVRIRAVGSEFSPRRGRIRAWSCRCRCGSSAGLVSHPVALSWGNAHVARGRAKHGDVTPLSATESAVRPSSGPSWSEQFLDRLEAR